MLILLIYKADTKTTLESIMGSSVVLFVGDLSFDQYWVDHAQAIGGKGDLDLFDTI